MLKYVNSVIILMLSITTTAIGSGTPISYVTHFNSKNYLGTWYEVARLPMFFENNCIPPIKAHYAIDPHDSNKILVTNSCAKKEGGYAIAEGVAHFVETPSIGKLSLTFLPVYLRWLPFGHGAYWVIATDYTHYALVGDPNHRYLWILSRSNTLGHTKLNDLVLLAKSQGFNTTKLIFNQ